MGLSLFAKNPSNVVTTVNIPESVGADKVVKRMMADHGMRIVGGQDHLKGKIIRISHLGYVDAADMISCIAALENTVIALGHKIQCGAGVSAAAKSYQCNADE
jgi:aspartate aminotransferase-like enzyme